MTTRAEKYQTFDELQKEIQDLGREAAEKAYEAGGEKKNADGEYLTPKRFPDSWYLSVIDHIRDELGFKPTEKEIGEYISAWDERMAELHPDA